MNGLARKCTLAGIAIALLGMRAYADDDWSRYARVVRESVEVSDLHVFGTTDTNDGATILVRDFNDGEVHATVTSRDLAPRTAYSIWIAAFNHPKYCAQPYACSTSDLEIFGGNPKIKASVFWGGGLVADEFGYANTAFDVPTGRTSRELFAQSGDYGLQNLGGAEIHVVLRSHGEAGVAGPVAMQIGSAMQACPPAGCVNAFFSVHKAQP
jgi:hypothetical protein